jgi:hypothetical protein
LQLISLKNRRRSSLTHTRVGEVNLGHNRRNICPVKLLHSQRKF